jgi:hypothetical protein
VVPVWGWPRYVHVREVSLRRVAEYNHKLRRIDPNGTITTVVGNGVPGNAPYEGPGSLVPAHMVSSVTVLNPNTFVLFSDDYNQRMQRYNPSTGMVAPVAGNGVGGTGCESCQAQTSSLFSPSGSTWDPATVRALGGRLEPSTHHAPLCTRAGNVVDRRRRKPPGAARAQHWRDQQ